MAKIRGVTAAWAVGHVPPDALRRDNGKGDDRRSERDSRGARTGGGVWHPGCPGPRGPGRRRSPDRAAATRPVLIFPAHAHHPPGRHRPAVRAVGPGERPADRVGDPRAAQADRRRPAAAGGPRRRAEARAERRKLLGQIDDYLLPRLRQSGSPVLVALVGSTGAGKSTLVNSIVGAQVSMTGIRRPTTNSPVLACHPDEVDWFAENVFLPTVPRVRQEGPGPVGPRRAARAGRKRGHAQGRRPARHPRHRLGGGRRTGISRTSSSTPPTCGCS